MSLVDERGRLFGRINLVDAAVLVFLLGLLPIGYATYLLFRPAQPRIDSVTQVDLSKEEYRIASGATVMAKLKVKGTGFNPLLRAIIDGTPALAFVYENPNSADVSVGELPPGAHDLILYDGVQEVARAKGAVHIEARLGMIVRAVGRIVGGDTNVVKPGYASAKDVRGAFEVAAIGSPQPSMTRVVLGDGGIDVPTGGTELPAVLLIHCDEASSSCSIGGVSLANRPPVGVSLPGGFGFVIDEIFPTAPPTAAQVEVAFGSPQAGLIKPGDRDALIDTRAAVVKSVAGARVTLALGADRSRDGWSYRGQRLRPGAPFKLITKGYEAEGSVVNVSVTDGGAKPR